ncbi:beta-ketoacyl-ACP synthase [Moorena bouillonii]|uniref:3-oxoacyl-ACP synthase n=1 Tax=Moorena bouillonii PNG TaxID=568701 RepID=A0A1U7MYA8_9CYAN|nr:beta-ketoacyl-ACP synthase [Moorena bouillonii]OLT58686.1 3-oxoacyl-ACP synthase [Moorena bouillonii PNG]
MQVCVTGIGLVSALGRLKPSWQHLLNGESAIRWYRPFANLSPLPLAMIGQTPASVEQLIYQVVADALEDANLTIPLKDCGVVIGSSRSCQAAWEQLAQEQMTSHGKLDTEPEYPRFDILNEEILTLEHWLDTLPHQPAIAAAHYIGSFGPVLAPMAACATGIWAIAQGFELIQTGQCQRVIAGAVEAPITPLTLAGFTKMGALAKTGAYPFDKQRQGLVLAEGGSVLVLESEDLARRRAAPIYGKLLGFGLTSDAYHVSKPNPDRHSAIAAIKQCLDRSHLFPTDIDYIHTHGTGTKLNDQNEAELIQQLFPQGVAISSTKGATGHTLGASGAIGTAFCLMALKHQVLPPCIGLRETEWDLDFVTIARQCQVRQALCFSFGFGGQNAVTAIGISSNCRH